MGTLLLIAVTIYQAIVTIKKLKKEENSTTKKLAELELNLRDIMGPKYKIPSS